MTEEHQVYMGWNIGLKIASVTSINIPDAEITHPHPIPPGLRESYLQVFIL